jgi:putative peptidoglycan lipid II flippase
MLVLIYILDRRLNGMPLKSWSITILGLIVASAIAGGASWGVYHLIGKSFDSLSTVLKFGAELVGLAIASAIGFTIFGAISMQLKIPEIKALTNQIKRRFSR